jgi:hypothetical protein
MDDDSEIKFNRTIISDLRAQLHATLAKIDAANNQFQRSLLVIGTAERECLEARAEAKHQAQLCMQLIALLCKEDMAQEAADIVGVEAVEAVQKCIGKDECDDSGD